MLGIDGNIYTVNLNTPSTPNNSSSPAALQFHKGPISALRWSLDERVLISCGAEDGQVAFWDAQSHQLLKSVLLTSKRFPVLISLVIGKSDPLNSSEQQQITNYAPFKRVGNQITSISSAAPITPISFYLNHQF